MEFVVIYCTVPNKKEANIIAKSLVEQKLAACVSCMENIRSTFSWQGEICEENELLLMIKTKRTLFGQIEAVIKNLHSYNVPEIIALPIVESSKLYQEWLEAETL